MDRLSHRGRKLAAGVAVALLFGATAGVAVAQTSEPTPAQLHAAAEAFDHGRAAFNEKKFAEAAQQFERADATAESSTALELAMKSRERAGHLDRAATLAALSLERHPKDEKIAKDAPPILSRARTELYELSVRCAPPCDLADGPQIIHGAAAERRTVFLVPGEHAIRASWPDGTTQAKIVRARAGANGELQFAPAPEATPVERQPVVEPVKPAQSELPPLRKESEPDGSGWSPVVFWLGAGATLAAAGVTTWSGVDTLKDPGKERVREECAAGDENCEVYQEGRSKQLRTNVLIGVTSGLAVATGITALFAVDWGGKGRERQARNGEPLRATFGWNHGPTFRATGHF